MTSVRLLNSSKMRRTHNVVKRWAEDTLKKNEVPAE
jgi:hypothetical protein